MNACGDWSKQLSGSGRNTILKTTIQVIKGFITIPVRIFHVIEYFQSLVSLK